ncbi:MAG TPA: DUF2709 domain-containing protein [Chlamydiales bacterium]|nr:DUF2709 domain-containing protein [Chlamydiales bacterium]
MSLSESLKKKLLSFLKKNKQSDIVSLYLYYIEQQNDLQPVLFPKEKKIYKSLDELIKKLEAENKLWRETEITVRYGKESVNENTKKIYICPFTGKVFGDNTHLNPQDAIYDWVSKCPENTERVDGLPAKRFHVSDDPEMIKKYMTQTKKPTQKKVFSSVISGKLFNSKKAVLDDFIKNHIKHLTLFEVQNQNRFEIENSFLEFLQDKLSESKIAGFVEELSQNPEFQSHLEEWFKE